MANPIIQAIYDLKDLASAKLKIISDSLKGNRAESDKTANTVDRNAKRQSDAYKQQADSIGFLRENLGKIAAAAAAAAAALKLIDLGKSGFSAAADVEQSLSRVQAIAKSTGEDFAALADQIDKSAIAANVSSEAAAGAAAALAEQGESAKEIFDTLTPTLLLARDANIEVAAAAGIVDDALDLFGKSAGEAALVVDQLVVASKGSKEGLAGLANAVRSLAPDAQALGLSFEQLTGLLGLLGQNGIDAGKAAKGLRSIFQDLQDPTSQLSTSLGKLGDTSGDFSTAIETLRNAGDGGKEALLGLDGASRSLVLFLLNQAPGAVEAFTAALQNAQGAASEMRKEIDHNLKGAFTELVNAFDHLGAGLAESSLGPLRDELQKLAGQLNAFAESPAFAELQKALGEVFTEGTKAFDNFIKNVDWPGFVASAQTALKGAGQSIGEFKDDLSAVATALNTIGSSIGVVFRSVAVVFDLAKVGISGLMVGLSSGLLAQSRAVDLLTGKTSELTIALESVRDSSKEAAEKGITALRADSDKLVENLEGLGGTAEETAKKIDALRVSFANVKAGVDTTAATFSQTATDFNALSGAVENTANLLGILPEMFDATGKAEREASQATHDHAQEIIGAREAAVTARAALEEMIKAGTASASAMQTASVAYDKAQQKLDELTGKANLSAEAQRGLEQAFKALGISSQAALKKAADDARTSLDTIRQAFLAGNATIEDVKRAYDAYAAKVRASVADSSAAVKAQEEAILAAKAAALGLTDAVTQAGTAGKDAGDTTADAFGKAATKIDGAAAAADNLASNADDAAAGLGNVGGAAQQATQTIATATQGIVLLTAEQLSGLRQIGQELAAGGLTLQQYEERVQEVMTGTSAAIERQIDQLKRFNDRVLDLQAQLAQENGDDVGAEDARHKKALEDIKAEATLDGELNGQQYNELKRLEEQIHQQRLKNIEAEKRAKRDTDTTGTDTSSGGGGGGVPQPTPAPAPRAPAPTINVMPNVLLLSGDRKATRQLAQIIARDVKSEIDAIVKRSL